MEYAVSRGLAVGVCHTLPKRCREATQRDMPTTANTTGSAAQWFLKFGARNCAECQERRSMFALATSELCLME